MPEKQICEVTGQTFEVGDVELEILRSIGSNNPILLGERLPLPTVHPYEFLRRMYVFGSLRFLFKTKSAISGKPVLTRYNPDIGHKVCTQEEFFDSVENVEVGRDIDFSRPFFEQWYEVFRASILPPLNKINCEDSEFVNGAINLKNCYLCFACLDSRDCLYCFSVTKCEECVDLVKSSECQYCYSSVSLVRCYGVQNSRDCKDCTDCFGCHDCLSCTHCFGCVGLLHQSYCVFNKQVSKEAYEKYVSEADLTSFQYREVVLVKRAQFWTDKNRDPHTIINCEDCTGAYLERCQKCELCWDGNSCRNCAYLVRGVDAHYASRGMAFRSSYLFETHGFDCQNTAYCYTVTGGVNDLYSAFLIGGCNDCFGCVALNRKQYCILNKQYSKAEYYDLAPKLIGHMKRTGEWGQWFPVKYAPHYYHESSGHEFMEQVPLEVVIPRGYRTGPSESIATPQDGTYLNEVPDRLNEDAYAKLMGIPIRCGHTGKLFKLQKRELEFYKIYNIPPPRIHWRERMERALTQRKLIPGI